MGINTRRDYDDDEDNIRLYLSIIALTKCISKDAEGANCPICMKPVDIGDHYCRWCGQKISWRKFNGQNR